MERRALPAAADAAAAEATLVAGDRAPVDELLRHVAAELRRLCAAAREIETIVAALVTDRGANGLHSLQGLQELDRLIQHIDGLGEYLGGLADACAELEPVNAGAARRRVKLARLAADLAGEAQGLPPAGGEVEFL